MQAQAKLLVRQAIINVLDDEADNLNEELVDDDGARMMELVIMLDHLMRTKDYFEKGMECNEPS